MSYFNTSLNKVLDMEGLYSDHPADAGGETYRGIARRRWHKWRGWTFIDTLHKENPKLEDFLIMLKRRDAYLYPLVEEFYQINFWSASGAEAIRYYPLAYELFDTAVNMGVSTAVRLLQDALNLLNKNEQLYHNLKPDGAFGLRTQGAIGMLLKYDDPSLLLKLFLILKGGRYVDIMRSNESQEVFARGWLRRVPLHVSSQPEAHDA